MIVVRPQTYTKVEFDSEHIHTLAQRALESVAALPDDLDVKVNVGEDQATNRAWVSSVDPVTLEVDGGALENYKMPRSVGELESSITFTRLFLEVVDRLSTTFGAPPVGEELSHAQRMAWSVNLYGRTSRHGLHVHQPRYRYNFRNRHGFSDLADRNFDKLWSADELTWDEIVQLSNDALDPVITS